MPRALSLTGRATLIVPILAAVAVFANTLDGEFVYDDNAQIVGNPWIQDLRHLPRAVSHPVWAFMTTRPTNYFRPIQMGAYNLVWAAGGGRPLPFHLLNLALHAAVVGCVVLLVRRVSRDPTTAFGAGLLFAVHPVNTEVVAWIACLPELSYSLLVLGALLLHVGSWERRGARRVGSRAAAVAVLTVAMFAKETAASMVGMVFVLELFVRPSIAAGPPETSPRRRRGAAARFPWWPAAAACLPYLGGIGLYALVRISVVGGVAPHARTGLTAYDAVLNAPSLLLGYVRVMLAPVGLLAHHVFDPVRDAADPRFLVGSSAVAVMAVAAAWLVRRRPDLALAGALAILPLAPVLYIPAVGENAFAERYAYLPSVGVAWLVAAAIVAAARKRLPRRARVAAVSACVLLALPAAVASVARNRVWHDDRVLSEATLEREPRARTMWILLARWHRVNEQYEEALSVYREALRHLPGNPWLETEIIRTEMLLHRISAEEGVRRFRELLARGYGPYFLHVHLGYALMGTGDAASAAEAFRRALEINPSSKEAHEGLKLALIDQGIAVLPETGETPLAYARDELRERLIEGAAHLEAGRLDRAREAFEEVLRLDPESHQALLSLALVASRSSDLEACIDYCRRAIEVKPDLVDAYQQMAVAALKLGDLATGVEALEKAVSLAPHSKEIYNRLGVAYVRAGRPEQARRAWERALEIDPSFEKARFNLERLERLSREPDAAE